MTIQIKQRRTLALELAAKILEREVHKAGLADAHFIGTRNYVNQTTEDQRRDPRTGRANADWTELLVLEYLRKETDYIYLEKQLLELEYDIDVLQAIIKYFDQMHEDKIKGE